MTIMAIAVDRHRMIRRPTYTHSDWADGVAFEERNRIWYTLVSSSPKFLGISMNTYSVVTSPEAILHDTAKFMSASSFTIGNQITQQKIFLADSNIQNRWHWRTNPPLRSTMWKNLPKVTNHKLDLNAFYAPEIIFIHIIAQKLQSIVCVDCSSEPGLVSHLRK